MSIVKVDGCDNLTSMEKEKFRKDDVTDAKFVAVTDEDAQAILTQILAALGGSSDTTTTVSNITIINANVEQSISLPANTKKFLIRSRNKGKLKLAYASGGTTTSPYFTAPKGTNYVDDQFYSNLTVYVQSDKVGDILELITYV